MNINVDIPGWMTPQELGVIAHVASHVQDNSVIVELGSYCGRSAWAWQYNMPLTAKLDLVDVWNTWHRDDLEMHIQNAHGSDDNKKKLLEFITAVSDGSGPYNAINYFLPKDDRVTKYKCDVMKYEIHTEPSVVFIDAEHTLDAVTADIMRYRAFPNCLLMGHDFAHYGMDVVEAVLKTNPGRTLINPKRTSIWIAIPEQGYWYSTFKTIAGDFL